MSQARKKRGFNTAGGGDPVNPIKNWEARVDKDPFYRTMDIFNGVFNKKIKLVAGKVNRTDLHVIEVNFGELKPSRIAKILRPGADDNHSVFLLECGHEWEGLKITKNGIPKAIGEDYGMCGACGADTIYRGFEHEWQHIIFKSDLAAMAIFCSQYADQLISQSPSAQLDKAELVKFIHKIINAFDDLRVNSLWEKVYPGSAMAIWDRWRFFVSKMENINTSFMAYIFAIAFGIPTNPQGEFEPMRPVIERAVREVKYRGFNKMLLEVRVVLDRCMGAILAKMKPKPPQTMQPPPPPSLALPPPLPSPGEAGQGQNIGSSSGQSNGEGEQSQGDDNGNEDQHQDQEQDDQNHQKDHGGQKDQQTQVQGKDQNQGKESHQEASEKEDRSSGHSLVAPSAQDVTATDQDREDALTRLMKDQVTLDEKEEHPDPIDEDLEQALKSQALRAALAKVMNQDIKNLDALGSDQTGEPDADMQAQIDQLLNGIAKKSEASQLTDGARAKVTIIEVTRAGKGDSVIQLDQNSKADIQRLRATFLRAMGKQKAKRSSTGTAVDIESLIQYLGDHQDPDIFENQDVNQGFAYSVVCDMSGSMKGCFPVVCEAVEMLKQALEFPFVVGNLWGFRGGQSLFGGYGSGDVWMYRYAHDVDWYTGTTPFRFSDRNKFFDVPVECGGITPMNAAINVATSHLWRKMPAGMAKRMFLLTDGSPVHVKVTGARIPEFMLRQFVANEIKKARTHGIEVYTIVIGEHAIDDERCLQMFGQRKFWVRVDKDRVGMALLELVLRNFNRYLRRG